MKSMPVATLYLTRNTQIAALWRNVKQLENREILRAVGKTIYKFITLMLRNKTKLQ